MAKTDRQQKASDALEAAIMEARDAWSAANPGSVDGTVIDWIVVTAEVKPDMEEPENDIHAYSILMPNGGIPWYRGRGLLEAGIRYLEIDGERD